MTRPTPEWVSRASLMQVGEAIVTAENLTPQAFTYHLRRLPGTFKTKSTTNGRQICRVG